MEQVVVNSVIVEPFTWENLTAEELAFLEFIRSGDEVVFGEWMKLAEPHIKILIRRWSGVAPIEDLEDTVSAFFFWCYQNAARVYNPARARPAVFIRVYAKFRGKGLAKKRSKEQEVFITQLPDTESDFDIPDTHNLEDSVVTDQLYQEYRQGLSEIERRILDLRQQGHSSEEIGEFVSKKPGTVRQIIHRACKKFDSYKDDDLS